MSRASIASVAAAAALALGLFADAARADDASDALPERSPPSSVRIPIILGGLGVAGGAYGLGMLVARTSPDVPGSTALAIPVAGPWIALGQNACGTVNPDCGALKGFRGVMLAFEGVVQIAGLALAGEGILLKTGSSAPKDSARFDVHLGGVTLRPDFSGPAPAVERGSMHAASASSAGGGLGISGSF
ncbi:MAG TPA: hypothetical protein VGM56_07605 [Byssovorax sp.]|jgi:hypothetical protein